MPIRWQPFKGPQNPPANYPFNDFGVDNVPSLFPLHYNEPAIDIYQDKDNLYVEISLGGIDPKNVDVSVEDDVLTITGKSEVEDENNQKDYLRREIKKEFRRVIKLPMEVKSKQTLAEVASGILKVTMPKAAEDSGKTTKVPIKIK